MHASVKSQTGHLGAHMVLLGTGYTARALIPFLKQRGFQVTGTARSAQLARRLEQKLGVNMVQFDGKLGPSLRKVLSSADYILSSIPPQSVSEPVSVATSHGDPVIGMAKQSWAELAPNCCWAGYLSATSVYGDREGKWAFEDEALRPASLRGRARIGAELAWLESALPVHIFRLAGIYGPDDALSDNGPSRNPLTRLRRGRRPIHKPGHVVNRIYVQDAARALLASIDRPDPKAVYNIADGAPAPVTDIMDFSALLLACPRPVFIDYDKAELSGMARSFYAECKRVDISRVQRKLGWKPDFPSYKHGLLDIWRREMGFDDRSICLAGQVRFGGKLSETVQTALTSHSALSRQEPGCLHFDVKVDDQDGSILNVTEVFDSAKSFTAHQARTAQTDWARRSAGAKRDYTVIGPL